MLNPGVLTLSEFSRGLRAGCLSSILVFIFYFLFFIFRFQGVIQDKRFRFEFDPYLGPKRSEEQWVNYRGETPGPSTKVLSAEEVAEGVQFSLDDLHFRDPNYFIAGSLHRHLGDWEYINAPSCVLEWLANGVRIEAFFTHFKGNFKGKSYVFNLIK